MLNRNFATIYGNIGTNIQDTSSGMAAIIKSYANDIYRDVLRRTNWEAQEPDYQITTVAGTSDYILPSNFGKEMYVYDTINKRYIPYIGLSELIEKFPASVSSQGSVERYTIIRKQVRNQPTSASTLSIVSSNSSDTSQVIRLKYIDSNDIEQDESVTLNGTTSVPSVGSPKSIRSISKSATTTGSITITSNGGSVTVAILAPADIDYKVKAIRFHEIPSSVLTLSVPYHIEPYPLMNDYDVPVIDCADIIELGATAKAWRYKRQFAKATDFEVLYEKGIIQLMWDKENQPNETHTLNVKTDNRNFIG
jgi:hypothetical protein